jgi:hypothetical protein
MSSSKQNKSFKYVSDINYENDYKPTVYNNETDVGTNNDVEQRELSGYDYISAVVGVLFIIYILNWLNNIDKCTCSHIPEGKYLKEWFTIFIIIDLIWLFTVITFGINNVYVKYLAVLILFVGITNMVFIIRTIIYIHTLKKNKCKCGSVFQQSSIYGVLLFGVSFIAFCFLILLITFIASFFTK